MPEPASAGPRRRQRVAMVAFDFGDYCVPIANELSRRVDVALIQDRHVLATVGSELDPRVLVLPFDKPRLRQPLRQVAMCWRILRSLRRFRPDVVHLQQGHLWFNLLALPFLATPPLVLTIHDVTHHPGDRPSRKTPQRVIHRAFGRADRVIIHAERLRQEVVRCRDVRPDVLHVIPHVALAGARPVAGAWEDRRTVLFFGRIWPYKGLDYLIRAEPLITNRVPDARFVIAGEGEDLGRYRAMMRDASRFEVHNEFVSIERRAELFARAALVVLPYVEASQSGVVPVAYAHSKPVVATSVGGLPESVEDGRTGFVVPPRDEDRLADAIVKLLKDDGLRHRMGEAGRRKLEREWSAVTVAEQTLHVYRLALEQRDRNKAAEAA